MIFLPSSSPGGGQISPGFIRLDFREIATEEGVAVVEKREKKVFVEGALHLSPYLLRSREQKRAGVSRSETPQTTTFSAKQTAVLSRTRKLLTQGERGSREKQPRLCGRHLNLINSFGRQRRCTGAGTSPPFFSVHLIQSGHFNFIF